MYTTEMKLTIESDKPIKTLTIEFGETENDTISLSSTPSRHNSAAEVKEEVESEYIDKLYDKLSNAYVRENDAEVISHEIPESKRNPKVDEEFAGQSW